MKQLNMASSLILTASALAIALQGCNPGTTLQTPPASADGGDNSAGGDVTTLGGGNGGASASGNSSTNGGAKANGGGTSAGTTGGSPGSAGTKATSTGGSLGATTGGTPGVNTGGTKSATGGSPTVSTGGSPTVSTGGSPTVSTGGSPTVSTGGAAVAVGTGGVANGGKTVTFSSGKAVGAMTGYGFVALGASDSISSPTCGTATITAAASCTSGTTWSSTTTLCVTGSVPALPASPSSADYSNNWGLQVGVNATDPDTAGLGQSFTSVTITFTSTTVIPATALRAVVQLAGSTTAYCAALTSGTAVLFTSFVTDCWDTTPTGTYITAANVPNISQISVEVVSGSAAITVTNLCITGITFS